MSIDVFTFLPAFYLDNIKSHTQNVYNITVTPPSPPHPPTLIGFILTKLLEEIGEMNFVSSLD